jgi:uncharacterized OB-fold protein
MEKPAKRAPLEIAYTDWKPAYYYSLGELSPFFREVMENKRLMATKCPKCGKTWMPPRGDCSECYEETQWVEISGEGRVVSCSYSYFKGHAIDLVGFIDVPYVHALIHLDGTDTYMSHGVKQKLQKMGEIRTGTRVKAVFRDQRRGTLGDFYFVPVE